MRGMTTPSCFCHRGEIARESFFILKFSNRSQYQTPVKVFKRNDPDFPLCLPSKPPPSRGIRSEDRLAQGGKEERDISIGNIIRCSVTTFNPALVCMFGLGFH